MFQDTPVFSTFAVDDLQAAENFYSEILGLSVKKSRMGLLEVKAGKGTGFVIYPKPHHKPADFTVQNFQVENMDAAVDYLSGNEVEFEHYDNEYLKTDERGVSTDPEHGMKIAWFKDPAGNILSLIEDKTKAR